MNINKTIGENKQQQNDSGQFKVNLNLEMKCKIQNDSIMINDMNNLIELQWQHLYKLRQKET